MVRLRLRRTGRIKRPSYQIVAIDQQRSRDGRYLEKIGHYYPLQKKYDLDWKRAQKWLQTGAQPSKTVQMLLDKAQKQQNDLRQSRSETD